MHVNPPGDASVDLGGEYRVTARANHTPQACIDLLRGGTIPELLAKWDESSDVVERHWTDAHVSRF